MLPSAVPVPPASPTTLTIAPWPAARWVAARQTKMDLSSMVVKRVDLLLRGEGGIILWR